MGFTLPPSPGTSIEMTIPNLLAAHLSGLGQVMFLGHPAAGALIAAGLLLADRRAAGWALFGSAAGLAWALLQHENPSALSGLGGYNPTLVTLALSQQRRQPWLPLAGILLAVMLTPGFTALDLPPLTAPFILACWLIQATGRAWRQASLDTAPCALRGNRPRLR
jgi:urea transporter